MMQARDVMSRPVVTVTPATTAADAARLLCAHGFTALPVVEGDGLVGIVTEADLIDDPGGSLHPRPGRHEAASSDLLVRDVMSAPVRSLTKTADVADTAAMMVRDRIRSLPVVDGGRVIGIVTRRDLLRAGLAHIDQDLADEISRQLAQVDTPNRWRVTVEDGVADIEDYGSDVEDRERAARLAAEVPGVAAVRARHQTPDPF